MITVTLHISGEDPRVFEFRGGEAIGIGRAQGNALRVPDGRVSGLHGQIAPRDGGWAYRDLRSTNGSMLLRGDLRSVVDGEGDVTLADGDILLLGDADDPIALHVGLPRAAAVGRAEGTVVARRPADHAGELRAALVSAVDPGALLDLLRSLAGDTEVDSVFQKVAAFLLERLPAADEVLLVIPEESVWAMRRGDAEPRRLEGGPPPYPRGLVEQAIADGEGVLTTENAAGDPSRSLARIGAVAAVAVPLVHSRDKLGALVATGRAFTDHELTLTLALSWQVATSFANVRLLTRMRALERRLRDENRFLRQEVERDSLFGDIIGTSPAMQAMFEKMRVVMGTDASVLVLGETGTGKELVARALHGRSRRSERLFAAVNCAALAETLLESELFGHAKGAFTGATENKRGLFQVADGGTLFLDEIGELSPKLQAKLLRVLQEGEVTPVGTTRPVKVDVRIVAATHRDLRAEVKSGAFREDLFYRINVFPIRLPPLRERRDDLPALAQAFVDRYARRFGKRVPVLTDGAIARLLTHPFPGNVRELENEMQRAVLLAPDGMPVDARHLSDELQGPAGGVIPAAVTARSGPLKETMERLEREVVRAALEENGWNRSQTARRLGISRQALLVKLAKMGISPD